MTVFFDEGTFNPTEGLSEESQCTPCTPGYYCLIGSSSVSGPCNSGYNCISGVNVNAPDNITNTVRLFLHVFFLL